MFSTTTWKYVVRCKLQVDGNFIDGVMICKYLGIHVCSDCNIENEVPHLVNKGNLLMLEQHMQLLRFTQIYTLL